MAPCATKKGMCAFFILLLYAAFSYRTERSLDASSDQVSAQPPQQSVAQPAVASQPQKVQVVRASAAPTVVQVRQAPPSASHSASRQSSRPQAMSTARIHVQPQPPVLSSSGPIPVFVHSSANQVRKLQGHYAIEKDIGSGAFGRVHLATKLTDPGKGEKRAIKEVDALKFNQSKEGEVMMMNLPFVADLEEIFFENDKAFLVMQYYEGGDLAAQWKQILEKLSEKLSKKQEKDASFDAEKYMAKYKEEKMSWLGMQMAYGLWMLHRSQVLYGNVKFENTFIDKSGKTLVLANFGVAKHPCTPTACTKSMEGLEAYNVSIWSDDRRYGYEVDWLALGVLLYRMYEGKAPTRFATAKYSSYDDSRVRRFLVDNILHPGAFAKLRDDKYRQKMIGKASSHPILKDAFWHGETTAGGIDNFWYQVCKMSKHKDKCVKVE